MPRPGPPTWSPRPSTGAAQSASAAPERTAATIRPLARAPLLAPGRASAAPAGAITVDLVLRLAPPGAR